MHMGKLGAFLGRKTTTDNTDNIATMPVTELREDNVVDFDEDLFAPVVTQLGEANEAVRNLLVDAGSKIGELDAIKDAFAKLVDPINKTLRAFEEEKTKKINLQTLLNDMRAAYGKLRTEAAELQKKLAASEGETRRLREELSALQQALRAAESAIAAYTAQAAAQRTQIADLERRLHQETAERETTREENRRFGERLAAADKRIVLLESDVGTSQQKLLLAEQEKASLQAALDQAHSENARASRRLLETENTLAAAQTRMRQLETNFTEANAERIRLSAALEEANERHQNELNTQRLRFETLQARASATDRLLDEARATLLQRAEEIRTYERRMVETTLMRNAVESKLSEIETANGERETQFKDLETAHAALNERLAALTKSLKARETALGRAEETIGRLTDRVGFLEGERETNQLAFDKQIEEINTALQRERLERAMAEGALETARKDLARLRREAAAAQMHKGDYAPLPVPDYVNAA
jgi:crescentin